MSARIQDFSLLLPQFHNCYSCRIHRPDAAKTATATTTFSVMTTEIATCCPHNSLPTQLAAHTTRCASYSSASLPTKLKLAATSLPTQLKRPPNEKRVAAYRCLIDSKRLVCCCLAAHATKGLGPPNSLLPWCPPNSSALLLC